jgi:hypothetical protein
VFIATCLEINLTSTAAPSFLPKREGFLVILLPHFEILTFRKISFYVLCRLFWLHCECHLLTVTRYKNKCCSLLYIRNFCCRCLTEEKLCFYCSSECVKISSLILGSCMSLRVAHKYNS